jgi:CRISPR-associated protein Csm4
VSLYEILIRPASPFGTPLKGDTIFGHFCWQMAQDPELLNGSLDEWILRYPLEPFAVFSSAWPRLNFPKVTYLMKRPDIPLSLFKQDDDGQTRRSRLQNRKKDKGKKWLKVEQDMHIHMDLDQCASDQEAFMLYLSGLSPGERQNLRLLPQNSRKIIFREEQQHNSISRLTMTTGSGVFAPYSTNNIHFIPGLELAIFVYLDERAAGTDQLLKAFERIGRWGFGRDASTGLGRFDVVACEKKPWPTLDKVTACYSLAPCVPEQGRFHQTYFLPFTRFGRHGAPLVLSGKPFKNPVVMADEGAVFYPYEEDVFDKPFIGRAITGISKADPRTVSQGFSLFLPL